MLQVQARRTRSSNALEVLHETSTYGRRGWETEEEEDVDVVGDAHNGAFLYLDFFLLVAFPSPPLKSSSSSSSPQTSFAPLSRPQYFLLSALLISSQISPRARTVHVARHGGVIASGTGTGTAMGGASTCRRFVRPKCASGGRRAGVGPRSMQSHLRARSRVARGLRAT